MVIIGVLAAFAVPRFLSSVERSKAAESFNFLATVQSAQERYHARQGIYADVLGKLDIELTAPEYFTVGAISPVGIGTLETTWQVTLTRAGASAGYGAYTVLFNQDGYDGVSSTIDPDISPMQTAS